MTTCLVWLRQDLRVADNPALAAAAAADNVIPLYILDETAEWGIGAAQYWWLHYSLQALSAELAEQQVKLILRRGEPLQIINEIVRHYGVDAVYWNRCYEPAAIARDKKLKDYLVNDLALTVKSFNASLLTEPWTIANQQGQAFKVFTPYWKAVCQGLQPRALYARPKLRQQTDIASDELQHWRLLPIKPNWAAEFGHYWQPGARAAEKKLEQFLTEKLRDYATGRDHPAQQATSRLSAHLHFGEISPWQIWHACQRVITVERGTSRSLERFLTEIGWREFSYYLLYHFPQLAEKNFRAEFDRFPWLENTSALQAWQQGLTGYPIVDAGMRELWRTGYMHNRVRMIAASFLVKHLLLPWQRGEQWFWQTLVDADLANNSAGWQWVAGSGADAAPYFRIFNPILQGEKFDPQGSYVRRWLPVLTAVPDRWLHQPWSADKRVLQQAGVRLGENYPYPIIDHASARQRALAAYRAIK